MGGGGASAEAAILALNPTSSAMILFNLNNPIAEAYLAAWNEADDTRRRKLLEQGRASDARYVDPFMQGEGATASPT